MAEAEWVPWVAVMVAVPGLMPVASPLASTVMMSVWFEVQVDVPVTMVLVPSVMLDMAVSCSLRPAALLEIAELTLKALRVTGVLAVTLPADKLTPAAANWVFSEVAAWFAGINDLPAEVTSVLRSFC